MLAYVSATIKDAWGVIDRGNSHEIAELMKLLVLKKPIFTDEDLEKEPKNLRRRRDFDQAALLALAGQPQHAGEP